MITAVSFNTNSIRQRLHQIEAVIAEHSPDFIGIQETKVTNEDFPKDMICPTVDDPDITATSPGPFCHFCS